MIEVLRSGLLTTVQDLGRRGYQQFGMVVGGAVDSNALKVANVLVGNSLDEACLEMTMVGPVLKAHKDMTVAITGADMRPLLDRKKVPMWARVVWKKNQVLTFSTARAGLWCYMGISGGIDVPTLMGSRSTYVPAGIGGFNGRSLERGDRLPVGECEQPMIRQRLSWKYIPTYPRNKTIRVLRGPQHTAFTDEGMEAFFRSPYRVSNELNRMGIRLVGERVVHKEEADIPSQAIPFGTIQVASDGQPIVMLADRQTTGGYTVIANVITADYALLAQSMPGDKLQFQEVTLDEAHELVNQREKFWRIIGQYKTF